jgi:hypothetical protein
MTLRRKAARLLGAAPLSGMASSGKEQKTTRPVLSWPVRGKRTPQVLPEPELTSIGAALVDGVKVSETSGPMTHMKMSSSRYWL